MKRFSQFKLKIELILLFAVGVILLLDYAFQAYYSVLHVQAQLQQQQSSPIIGIKITSPIADQVPVGELTISGISTDNSTTDCTVYADWNNLKPFQTAVATGPDGLNDYSKWNFTYTPQYHIITNGTNELTAQISCFNSNTLSNITKSYSVNVTGIIESSEQSSLTAQNVSSSLPSVKIDNNDNNRTATATPPPPPSQIIPSVPTISPLPLQPAIKDDEEKEQTEDEPEPESEDEPEPESEPQPTTSPTEDDKTEEDTDEEENTSEQGKEVEEIQEEEEVQEQLQQILEKVGKVEQEVQQEVGKIEEDILEEIESGLR